MLKMLMISVLIPLQAENGTKVDYWKELINAIYDNNLPVVKKVLSAKHGLGQLTDPDDRISDPWLHMAVTKGRKEIVELLLDAGFDINTLKHPDSSAVGIAIGTDHYDIAELLVKRGANLNQDRLLIGSQNRKTPADQLKYVKLLVEHGIDVNLVFDWFGDSNNQFTALDWATDPAVKKYLVEHGAKTVAQLKAEGKLTATSAQKSGTAKGTSRATKQKKEAGASSKQRSEEVIDYFEKNVGTVDRRSLIEIVPTGFPIAIHSVPPAGKRNHRTLFTVGLSSKAMNTPADGKEYAYAELYIDLPGDWPTGPDCPADKVWLIEWVRKIAQHPHDNKTWLGGPLTVIDNEDPPEPLAPGVKFTSWLLLADKSFERADGKTVQLYRLSPLYKAERDMWKTNGPKTLLRAMDKAKVSFIFDPNRKPFAQDGK